MKETIRPATLIRKYYQDSPTALRIILDHSRLVTARAVRIARHLSPTETIDLRFIAEAAMLHDIGSIFTHAPEMGCFGKLPYICHGIKGSELLNEVGLTRHALVCERHTGVGLTAEEIQKNKLPLPTRDMIPVTLEEQIICYADLFYSKNIQERGMEKDGDTIRNSLRRFGTEKAVIFDQWRQRFEPELS